MKYQIFKTNGSVAFECDVPGDWSDESKLRHALNLMISENPELREIDLSNKFIDGVDFSGVSFFMVDFNFSEIDNCNFNLSNIQYCGMRSITFCKCSFVDCDVYSSEFHWSYFFECSLSFSDVYETIGDGSAIKNISTDIWDVTYTHNLMRIGCQLHPIEKWWKFTDEDIDRMEERALDWWRTWKPILQQVINAAPAQGGEK